MRRGPPATYRTAAILAGLAVVSGTLYFVGFAGINQWYLAFLAYVPFAELVRRANSGRGALWAGWLMGLVANLGGYYWIPGTLERFGDFPMPLAMFFYLVLCLWGGLLFGLLAWGLKRWWMAGGRPFPSLIVGVVFAEFVYPLIFPSYLANSLWQLPVFLQIVELGGPLLLSAVVVAVSTALFLLLRWLLAGESFPKIPVLVATGALAATLGYGALRIWQVDAHQQEAEALTVGVVQSNMGIYEKHDDAPEGHRRHLVDSLSLQAQGVDLVLWPESAYLETVLEQWEPGTDLSDEVTRRADVQGQLRVPLLFGALRVERRGDRRRLYNSAVLLDTRGRIVGHIDKTYLLAFGEYLPFGETFPWLYKLSPRSGRFTPGTKLDALPFRGRRIGVLICYEDVLPGFTRKLMNATCPDLLVNLTNDAWFGKTTQPEIHLALSVFRAVEHRRWLVRATNTGISAVVDPVGRVVVRSGLMTRETLRATVRWQSGKTVYGFFGDWPGWLSMLAVGWASFRMWRRGHLRLPWRRAKKQLPGTKVKSRK